MEAVPITPDPTPEPLGLDSLTAGETAMAEKTAGQSITTLGNEGYPQANLLGALGWVLYRRTEPRSKFADYMATRTLTDITRELGLAPDEETEDEEAEGKDDDGSTSEN